MASATFNKSQVLRSAAILTTSEVMSSDLSANNASHSRVSAHVSFTKGSLTNGIFSFYVSNDGSTYVPVTDLGGTGVSETFTADTEKVYFFDCSGWRYFAIGVKGTGTVTSSSATVTARYLRRGAV